MVAYIMIMIMIKWGICFFLVRRFLVLTAPARVLHPRIYLFLNMKWDQTILAVALDLLSFASSRGLLYRLLLAIPYFQAGPAH